MAVRRIVQLHIGSGAGERQIELRFTRDPGNHEFVLNCPDFSWQDSNSDGSEADQGYDVYEDARRIGYIMRLKRQAPYSAAPSPGRGLVSCRQTHRHQWLMFTSGAELAVEHSSPTRLLCYRAQAVEVLLSYIDQRNKSAANLDAKLFIESLELEEIHAIEHLSL